MKIVQKLAVFLLCATLAFTGCKPKDADIKASVEEKLKANQETAPAMVMVNDAVVTLSGEVANDNAKAEAETMAKDAKGVKSVVNNLTVTPPVVVAPPVVIDADATLKTAVMDATKDHPTVKAEVMGGVITLNGEIKKADLPKLMMTLNALNPKKVDNKLVIK